MKKISKISFNEYINNLPKSELTIILKTFKINYRSNYKREKLATLIIDNLKNIVDYSFNLFQNDELTNLKTLIKNNGYARPRTNYLLLYFLQNLNRLGLVINLNETEFFMPKDVLLLFKLKVKDKENFEIIKKNTKEYSLILGILNCYGVLKYNKFYEIYSLYYDYSKEELLNKLRVLKNFYKEFNLIENKNDKYVCNNILKNEKNCKKICNEKSDYKVFASSEFMQINDYKYMKKYHNFNKLIKFVKRNYYLDDKDIKVFYKFIIMPYINEVQIKASDCDQILSANIDKYFEYKNEKHKTKFINLIKNIIIDYPMWELNGFSQKEVECQK